MYSQSFDRAFKNPNIINSNLLVIGTLGEAAKFRSSVASKSSNANISTNEATTCPSKAPPVQRENARAIVTVTVD